MDTEEPILQDALDDVIQQLADRFGLQKIMPYYSQIRKWVEAGLTIAEIIIKIVEILG